MILMGILSSPSNVKANPLEYLDRNYTEIKALSDWHINRPPQRELCRFCFITMPIVRQLLEENETEYFQGITTYFCESLKLADKSVCEMAIKTYQASIVIFNN
jgi:hypothetical protein